MPETILGYFSGYLDVVFHKVSNHYFKAKINFNIIQQVKFILNSKLY